MEQDLPIDIHTGKLLDWLISRRHVNREWPDCVHIIREKINNAIQDMPEHPQVTKLLSGTYINYFHCLQMVDILRETEKDSKNILGWYTSQRMKDWQEVVKLYERDNVYLAEAAQMLVRNVSYEITALKRQINKCGQIQEECDRKDKECVKNIADAHNKYIDMCKIIGIRGEKIKRELIDLLGELPTEFEHIAVKSQKLSDARKFYMEFLSFTCPSYNTECLPIIKYIMEHGNVTVYEWTYGEAPISIEETSIHYDLVDDDDDDDGLQDSQKDSDDIDFGAGDNGIDLVPSEEVDFGDDDGLTTGEIDWGNLPSEDNTNIDWGGVQECDDITRNIEITVEDSGVAGGIARDTEALSLLHNPNTRNQFINELLELEGFLSQRMTELSTEGSVLSMNQFAGGPHSLQYQSVDSSLMMRSSVQGIIDVLTSTKMQHLYLIASSARYVDRLTASLNAKKAIGDKLARSKITTKETKGKAAIQQQQLNPKLQLIIQRTKELQLHIEQNISKKYKNREVNLMGGVNTL